MSGLSGVVAVGMASWRVGTGQPAGPNVKVAEQAALNGSSKRRRLKSRALRQRKLQQAKKQQELLSQRRQLRPWPLQQDVAGEPQGEAEQSHEEEQKLRDGKGGRDGKGLRRYKR